MRRFVALAACLLFAGTVLPAGAGHLDRPRVGMREVGFHPLLGTGFNTDVWAHATRTGRLYAYSGTWGTFEGGASSDACPSVTDDPENPQKSGIKIVDVTNPARPRLAKVIGTVPGAQANDVQVERIATRSFSGDVLAHSLEPCGVEDLIHQRAGAPLTDVPTETTGVQLYNVTNPAKPVKLGTYNNGGLGTHNFFLYSRPDLRRAYVAAVFNEIPGGVLSEVDPFFGEVRGELHILDVTDPRRITRVARYDLEDDDLSCDARGTDSQFCFLHDVWVSEDGKTAYLSWWDAGLVLVDLTDPTQPQLIGRAQEQVQGDGVGWLDEEGNTHSAVPAHVGGRHFVVVGDEDFEGGDQRYAEVSALAPAAVAGDYIAQEWAETRSLDARGVTGPLFYAGGGCSPTDYARAPESFIALVDVFNCDPLLVTVFEHKLAVAQAAGASALILIDNEPVPSRAFAVGDIPAASVGTFTGERLRRNAAPGELTGVRARLHSRGPVNPWGFMRVVDVTSQDPRQWRETATFKGPHVESLNPGEENTYTAHNPFVVGNRIYFSWYTDGVRVLDLLPGGSVRQVAWFVPTRTDHRNDLDEDPHGAQGANVGFWGVMVARHPRTGAELIFASDINRGIYILEMVP